jgi:hypothetical protein
VFLSPRSLAGAEIECLQAIDAFLLDALGIWNEKSALAGGPRAVLSQGRTGFRLLYQAPAKGKGMRRFEGL